MLALPSGTVTFLFTDIEGSTRLWEQRPDAMSPALAHHDALLKQMIEEHRGALIKWRGDGVHAAFTTAPDALAAALDIQLALQKMNHGSTKAGKRKKEKGERVRQKEEGQIGRKTSAFSLRVRIGLHTGISEERDGDYFGPTLNRAARLLELGHGGQILLSAVTQELVRDQLPSNSRLDPLGKVRLRNLERPEEVFQLLHPDLPAEFPPLRSLDNLPNNLPFQLTSFIGREEEMEEIKSLLGKTRLLTLTGSGGCGKTRLALQVAAEVLDQYPDGVWLVELATISDANLVPKTIASVLNVPEEAGIDLLTTLARQLKSKSQLLILDNCEHLEHVCTQTARTLLRACPGLKILVTSRSRLDVEGATTWRVPSFSVPSMDQPPLNEALQYESIRLFIERATSVLPKFTLTERNLPALTRTCSRLDGIPLAIELAAARVSVLTVEQLDSRLDRSFRLLKRDDSEVLDRHKTLHALIDWSYGLLIEQEKTLLRRLSVFVGGWTLEAAEFVCSTDEGLQVFRSLGVQDKPMPTLGDEAQPAEVRRSSQPEYLKTRIPEHLNTDDVLDLLSRLVNASLVIADEYEGAQGGSASEIPAELLRGSSPESELSATEDHSFFSRVRRLFRRD